MKNINLVRYYDATGHSEKASFYNKLYRHNMKKFMRKHDEEYKEKNKIVFEAHETYEEDKISLDEFYDIMKQNQPLNLHPISKFFIMLPVNFLTWLCCGWKIYDKKSKKWTINNKTHLHTKLCRYKPWDDVKITWWDKVRFWMITGYRFEN